MIPRPLQVLLGFTLLIAAWGAQLGSLPTTGWFAQGWPAVATLLAHIGVGCILTRLIYREYLR